MAILSEAEVHRLSKIVAKATAGPWQREGMDSDWITISGNGQIICTLGRKWLGQKKSEERQVYRNSEMIKAGRNAMPDLIETVQALRRKVADLENLLHLNKTVILPEMQRHIELARQRVRELEGEERT